MRRGLGPRQDWRAAAGPAPAGFAGVSLSRQQCQPSPARPSTTNTTHHQPTAPPPPLPSSPQDLQSWVQIATEACGFTTIVAGTFLLHTTRDLDISVTDLSRLTKEPALGLQRRGDHSEEGGSRGGLYHSLELAESADSQGARSSKLWKQLQAAGQGKD